MPRFIAKKLWEYFAYPSARAKALLDEITADFIAGGFVVADLLRAIFLHDDFYSDAGQDGVGEEPVRVRLPRDARARARGPTRRRCPAHARGDGHGRSSTRRA